MKTKFCAFVLLLTLSGGAHAATLSDTAQAAVLSKKIIAAYTAEDYAKTQKLFMEYDQLDAAMPPPLMLVRVRFYYHISEFAAAHQLLGDYLNTTSPDSPDYDTALEMYVALEAKPEVVQAKAEAKAKREAEIAEFVAKVGHQPSPTGRDSRGNTDLHFAAKFNLPEVAALLIEKGADINAKDKDEKTPLHIAARENGVGVAALLIEKGANINAKDDDGDTPLGLARENGSENVAALLRKAGAR